MKISIQVLEARCCLDGHTSYRSVIAHETVEEHGETH